MSQSRDIMKEFKLLDKVAVIRTRHGWFDGRLTGVVVKLMHGVMTVRADDNSAYPGEHEVEKCRDVRKI